MYSLERTVVTPAPRSDVFRFFENTRNLDRITPRWTGFRDATEEGPPLFLGMRTLHHLCWFGVRLRWGSKIVEYEPPVRFVDQQTSGPYRYWRHDHMFEVVDGGTLMRDRVQYDIPFSILGKMVRTLIIERQLRKIFDYRETLIMRLFADGHTRPEGDKRGTRS